MKRTRNLILAIALILLGGHHAWAIDVVVVCPAFFAETLQPWIDFRSAEGLEIRVLESHRDAKELQRQIAEVADVDTKYVMLVGDAPVIGTGGNPSKQIPTHYQATTVTAKWGSTPTLSTDYRFGDFDADGKPDACVGRLPVQRSSELKNLIQRILQYEQSNDFGPWRGDLQLVAGVGGFGVLADTAIETVTRNIITGVLPVETRTSLLYASPGHAFYPRTEPFTTAVVNQYKRGARFWVYAGHGSVTELDRVPQNRDGVPVLDRESVARLRRPGESAPIALILACYTGAMDAASNSFAENMLMTSGGPVAVFAGSRVTMPYGNTTAAVGLIQSIYDAKAKRLGDAWVSTLRQMHDSDSAKKSNTRMLIDTLATVVSPAGTKLKDERAEHISLYNLLGDPTLNLDPPLPLALEVQPSYATGDTMKVELNSPIDGEARLTIDVPLGAVRGQNPNQTTIASARVNVRRGTPAWASIDLPGDVNGQVIVRAIVSGTTSWASGGARTSVRKQSPKP